MENSKIEYYWLDQCKERAAQAERALMTLGNKLPEACREIHRAPTGAISLALKQLRAIRYQYEHFAKEFVPFEDKAARDLIRRDMEAARPVSYYVPPAEREREGTPQYERLKARKGWPWLINAEKAAQTFGIAADVYYYDQTTPAARGSFDSKTIQVRKKFQTWAQKRASALHHLCLILSEFQRPGDRTNGGGPGKQAIAELIRDYVEEWQELDRLVVAALLEAVDR